jgi:hypothetical protein
VVIFTAKSGNGVRFRDRSGSNPPFDRVGDRVTVLYLESNAESAVIDRGVWNWVVPLLAFQCASSVLLGALTIGHKKIDIFPAVTAQRGRLKLLSTTAAASIREFQPYDGSILNW